MRSNSTLSPNKIIIFTVFICAAIMSSLFIFHLRNKPATSILSSDEGLIFPVAREIKPFDLTTADNQPFNLNNFYNHWTLLFFGFTHCSSICPTTLTLLNKVYANLHAEFPTLQVVFISLDPSRDTPTALKTYTHTFNPAFTGVSGKINEIHKLQSQLGIYSAPDTTTTNANYQLLHTASILLINPEGKWAGLFKFGMNPAQFDKAFKTSVAALSGG